MRSMPTIYEYKYQPHFIHPRVVSVLLSNRKMTPMELNETKDLWFMIQVKEYLIFFNLRLFEKLCPERESSGNVVWNKSN